VLGQVGAGFRYAQVRLAPARLTHCMRWLGVACRAHDIAADYARRRTAFGKPLGEHGGIGFMFADNAMDIHQSRLVICPPDGRPFWAVPGVGGDLAGRRPQHADPGRARHHRRHDRRPPLPRRPPVPIYDGASEIYLW